jgi:hypothetical protein
MGSSLGDGSDGATVRRPAAGVKPGDVSGKIRPAAAAQIRPQRDGQLAEATKCGAALGCITPCAGSATGVSERHGLLRHALGRHDDEPTCVPHRVGFGAPRSTALFERRLRGLSPSFANPAVQHDGGPRWPATGGVQNVAERLRSIPSNDDEPDEARHALT